MPVVWPARADDLRFEKKPASRLREAASLKLAGSSRLWEKEPDAGADQVLVQSAILVCIELGARILEEFILDKRADFGREKVIATSNHIPCQVRVTSSATSVEGFAVGPCERET